MVKERSRVPVGLSPLFVGVCQGGIFYFNKEEESMIEILNDCRKQGVTLPVPCSPLEDSRSWPKECDTSGGLEIVCSFYRW